MCFHCWKKKLKNRKLHYPTSSNKTTALSRRLSLFLLYVVFLHESKAAHNYIGFKNCLQTEISLQIWSNYSYEISLWKYTDTVQYKKGECQMLTLYAWAQCIYCLLWLVNHDFPANVSPIKGIFSVYLAAGLHLTEHSNKTITHPSFHSSVQQSRSLFHLLTLTFLSGLRPDKNGPLLAVKNPALSCTNTLSDRA